MWAHVIDDSPKKQFNRRFPDKALSLSSRRADAYVGRAKARLLLNKDIDLAVRDCCVALAVSNSKDEETRKSALLVRAKSRLALNKPDKDVESDLRKILQKNRNNYYQRYLAILQFRLNIWDFDYL